MCRLGGEFAGILRVQLPADRKPALVEELRKLQINGLHIVIRDDTLAPAPPGKLTKLEIVGADRPGIVREITSALAQAGVNVEEFSSQVSSAPMSGETLFKAEARLQIPVQCDLAALRKHLEKIAGDLLVDVFFADVP